MRKLTIKEIVPYLPYGLKVLLGKNKRDLTAISLDSPFVFVTAYVGSREKQMAGIENIKPILRPLSDLTKEIEHNGEKFVPIDVIRSLSETPYSSSFRFENGNFIFTEEKLESNYGIVSWVEYDFYAGNQYDLFQKLLEWHFDVFGLIDQNLAVDINTLNE